MKKFKVILYRGAKAREFVFKAESVNYTDIEADIKSGLNNTGGIILAPTDRGGKFFFKILPSDFIVLEEIQEEEEKKDE